MIFCPSCKRQNPARSRFCNSCGARLDAVCAACGHANPPDSRFCNGCGSALDGPQSSDPERRFSSPQLYTPKHLAERILLSKEALEGERKQVTVLFADLKGSMELLADRDPEEARRLLDPVLEKMIEAVHRYEGTVNQVMGDGIMALFGAPLALEDHAVRASYAALAMQAAIRSYSEELRRTQGLTVSIRAGLNSGEVVVRAIGNDLHMDYTAVGQTTHLAARMEQLADPGVTLMTAATLQLVEGFVAARPQGPVPVKGLADPVEVFELAGVGVARSRLQAAAVRGLTKFVGRSAELMQIHHALEQAQAGHGQIVALVGEPGVGKSRLVWEFVHSHRVQGWLVLESGSVSYGKASAYRPVIDLLKAYCQIEDRDNTRKIREKVTGKLLTLEEGLRTALPALLSLLDVPVDDAEWQALDPPRRRRRTLDALKHLVLRESRVQPLLLVFEDLHWIDTETQAFLDSVVESLPTVRIMLFVNYRPEYRHDWTGKTYYTQLRVEPLPAESAGELLTMLLGEDPGLQPLRPLLIQRTEGNPFFLEESVRALVETNVLVGARGAYRLAMPLEAIQVPATVQTVLAARIDRLEPEDKRLLQVAAVIGKDVPHGLLRAVSDLSEDALQLGLNRLQAGELLYEVSLFPEREYTFKHALTHEVAYGGLLQERRRTLHARIVTAVEELYRGRLGEHVEALARHALRGELWSKAAAYLRQAGQKAAQRSANFEAVAWFEQALTALAHIPETRETMEQAIDLRVDLRNSLLPLGEMQRIFDYIRGGEALAARLGDQRRGAVLASLMCFALWAMGRFEEGVEPGQRALKIAQEIGDFSLEPAANNYLGYIYNYVGDYPRAIVFLRKNATALTGELLYERFGVAVPPSILSRMNLAFCYSELGQFGEAHTYAEEALRIAETIGNPFALNQAYSGLGYVYVRRGDLPEATSAFERCVKLCREWNLPAVAPFSEANLSQAYILSDRIPEAIPMLEKALEQANAMGFVTPTLNIPVLLSQAYLLAGRRDAAIQLAAGALGCAREHKARGIEAWALRLHGDIASDSDLKQVVQAESHYREAQALAQQLGMRPLVAHCHAGLAKLHARAGQTALAQEHLVSAVTMYREMGMQLWLQKVEAELAAH